jgi:hypothetical protein
METESTLQLYEHEFIMSRVTNRGFFAENT